MVRLITDDLILDELERIQFIYEDMDIVVKCIKSLEEFNLGDKKIKLAKGVKFKIPFWVAKFLEEEEYVEIEESTDFNISKVHGMSLEEGKNVDLQKINNFFYVAMKQSFEEIINKTKTVPYSQQKKIEVELRNLMKMRLGKIIKIAEKSRNITTRTRNFSPEEKWLYQSVSDAVEKWKKMVKFPED